MKRALLTFLFFLPLWCVAQGRSAAEYPLGDTLRYDPVPYEVDLKTNLLMDATATINLGVEFPTVVDGRVRQLQRVDAER